MKNWSKISTNPEIFHEEMLEMIETIAEQGITEGEVGQVASVVAFNMLRKVDFTAGIFLQKYLPLAIEAEVRRYVTVEN